MEGGRRKELRAGPRRFWGREEKAKGFSSTGKGKCSTAAATSSWRSPLLPAGRSDSPKTTSLSRWRENTRERWFTWSLGAGFGPLRVFLLVSSCCPRCRLVIGGREYFPNVGPTVSRDLDQLGMETDRSFCSGPNPPQYLNSVPVTSRVGSPVMMEISRAR